MTEREREERVLREAEAGEASGSSRRGAGYGDGVNTGGAEGGGGGARAGGGKLALNVGDGVEQALRSIKDGSEGTIVLIVSGTASSPFYS